MRYNEERYPGTWIDENRQSGLAMEDVKSSSIIWDLEIEVLIHFYFTFFLKIHNKTFLNLKRFVVQ